MRDIIGYVGASRCCSVYPQLAMCKREEAMPTALKRVMVSIPKDLEEKLTAVAKAERRPLASMCVALIEAALKTDRYKEILRQSSQDDTPEYGKDFKSYTDLIPEDKRGAKEPVTPEKLKEAMALLEMMEKLKA